MKIIIGSDHGGFQLKEEIKKFLIEQMNNLEISMLYDFGCYSPEPVDYPDIAFDVAKLIKNEIYNFGILICGTGIGMSICANKIKSIRAALCHNTTEARLAREHNDAQILVLGGRMIGQELAKEIVEIFLKTKFSNEKRHKRRIGKIQKEEKWKK